MIPLFRFANRFISSAARFTKDHEYVDLVDGVAVIGITDNAQHELGDVVHVDLPEVGDSFSVGEEFAAVESVKAAASVYMPIEGEIIEINESIGEDPEIVNASAETDGWFIKVKVTDDSNLSELMDSAQYKEYCS